MKRLLLALALCLLPSLALAQCNGIFPNNTICGNITGSNNLPRPVANSALTGVPGGANGQVEYNNAGNFGGFTMSGDCTIVTSTGVITCPAKAGVDTNVLATGAVITTTPSVDSTFCSKTAALGGNAQLTVTVGAGSGFTANCVITFINVDAWASGRGKILSVSGLTLTPFPVLYPGQVLKLRLIGTSWVADPVYTFAQAPLGQKLFIDPGGSDSNDCLATGTANACLTPSHVIMGVIWSQLLATGGSGTGASAGFDVRLALDSSCVITTGVSCYPGLHFSGAPKQIEGFNSIIIECDGGSATNCTIADNTGNCAIGTFNGGINLELKNVTLAGGSGNNCLVESTAGQVRIESGVVFGPAGSSTTPQLLADGAGGRIIVEGSATITVAAGTSGFLAETVDGGAIQMDQATFSFAGNVTYGQQTLSAAGPGFIAATGVTWTLNGHTITSSHNISAINGGMVITAGGVASVPGTNSQIGTTPLPGWYN